MNLEIRSFTLPHDMVAKINAAVEKRQFRSKSDLVREGVNRILNELTSNIDNSKLQKEETI